MRSTATRQIAAGLSTLADAEDAARDAARHAGIAGPVDLAFLFVTPEHAADLEAAAEALATELEPAHLLACAAQGVVAGGRELEDGPAAAVWAASLPGATVSTFRASAADVADGVLPALDGAQLLILLVDPYTFPGEEYLDLLAAERPGLPVVGGIAVAGPRGAQVLVCDGEAQREGAVGVAVAGVPAVAAVSQGCAPLGPELVVTDADGNIVRELAGAPALQALRRAVAAASPEERQLAAGGVLLGLVIDENRPEYGPDDYLMRGVIGADGASGALAIGARARVGQTVRFHVRDAATADADLRRALERVLERGTPTGALLFTCNGRGTSMFSEPDHDARLVEAALGPGVAGFFCGGEIGPVGDRSFLHGFTATLAVFLQG
ncbi:MAG TPA: FIST N-terminal domain-containing protein [Gaiellaceae bacterium]|nr:FIST N-terminal domain-containing protein [Gaiellaceae bacterium]